jgi:hypothetical protein
MPDGCGVEVLVYATAFLEHVADRDHRSGLALLGGSPVPEHGLTSITGTTDALGIAPGKFGHLYGRFRLGKNRLPCRVGTRQGNKANR